MNSTTTTDDNRKRIYIERVAELLGISERSIWHRIKKLGISVGKTVGA